MTITLKWKDKRYADNTKYTYEYVNDDEWKRIKETFKIITKEKGDTDAKNYLRNQFTNTKNKDKLISLMSEKNKSYWTIYFKED